VCVQRRSTISSTAELMSHLKRIVAGRIGVESDTSICVW